MPMRVEIPAYRDDWMKGDRYGDVKRTFEVTVGTDGNGNPVTLPRAQVMLDKSRRLIVVNLDDCEVID